MYGARMDLLTNIFYWLIGVYLFLCFVYLWYLAVVRLNIAMKEEPEKVTTAVKVFAYPWLFFGLACDVVLGVVFGSILFLQLPSFDRLLFTAVLSYNANFGGGYRKKLARTICTELLDRFDWQRRHCECFEGSEGLDCK